MMRITVIALGRLKESYLRDACAEYSKRLQGFCQFRTIELTSCKLPDQPSESQILSALDKEAELIERNIPSGAKVVAMCIEGQCMSSETFGAYLQQTAVSGSGSVAFVIGSSFGLSEKLKQRADLRMSMSPMTFPHQLARVMLLEQIYRGFQILSGGKYHK